MLIVLAKSLISIMFLWWSYSWLSATRGSFDNQHNHQEQATEWMKIAENLQNCNLTVKYLFNYWVVSYGCVGSLTDKEWLFIVIDSVKRCQEHVSCHQQLRSSYILRRKRRKSKRLDAFWLCIINIIMRIILNISEHNVSITHGQSCYCR